MLVKWAIRLIVFFVLFSIGVFVYAVQSWEPTCSYEPSPALQHPCGR